MNNLTKAAAAAVGLLTLSVAVVPVVSAQDLSFLPGFGRATAEQVQGQMRGQGQKGPAGERGENYANLTFEEQQQKMLENLSRAQEQISSRLETMDQNEFMSEDVKNQLQNLINTHLSNMASYKTQIESASDEDVLAAVREQMHTEAEEMHQFMEENRPTTEQMQAHWDSMSFEEKQSQILSNLDRAIERTTDRQEKMASNTNVPEEVQTRINERVTEQLSHLNEVKTQVQNATSDEDLEDLRGEIGRGQGRGQGQGPCLGDEAGGMGKGLMQKGGNGQGLNQNTAE